MKEQEPGNAGLAAGRISAAAVDAARLLESMTEGVSVSNEHGFIVYTNRAEDEMFGYAPGELIGQHVTTQNAYSEEENRRVVSAVIARLKTEGAWQGEWRNRRKDGSEFITASRITALEVEGRPHWLCVQRDVTEERMTRDRLRESEEQLRLVADAIPALVSFIDRDLRYRFVNRAYELWFGRERDSLIGSSIEDVLGNGAIAARKPHIEAVFRGEPQRFEASTPRADGTEGITDVQYIPRRSASGEVEGFYVLVTDISDRKQIEAELRRSVKALTESEARFREVANAAPVLIWVADTKNEGTWYNKAWLDFTGRSMEQELGHGWIAGVHPDDLERCRAICGGSFEAREPFRLDFRLRRADGEWRVIDDTGVPRFAEDGAFLGYIGSCVDVTDARRAEAALRASEERYRRIFEQASDLIFTTDLNQAITDCNPAAAAALGLSRDEVVGRTISDFVSPEDLELTRRMLREKLERGGTTRYDLRVHNADQEWRDWEINSGLTFDELGSPVGLHVVARDVTDRKRWEHHQRLLVAELNHRVKNTLSIVQSVAHQTFAADKPPREAIAGYEGRLSALAAAHNLLTRENWESASIHDVVTQALVPFCMEGRCSVEGPDLRVAPRTAVSLTLALHELATNASKYGALSTGGGVIEIVWQVEGDQMELLWRESGGPPVQQPTSKGFGTRMIRRALASDLSGDVQLDFEPSGVICRVCASVRQISGA